MKIYDSSIIIKNSLEFTNVDQDLLDLLDNMLTEYAVEHSFKLPSPEAIDKADNEMKEAIVELCYMEKDKDSLCTGRQNADQSPTTSEQRTEPSVATA